MALTGLDIFKLLPKTNCGECGVPTCMAFAMKLASKNAELSSCPYASDEAIEKIGAASRPPVRLVRIGPADHEVAVGNETVMFRHEKTFVHPTAIALTISDDLPDAEIGERAEFVRDYCLERVGEELRIDLIAVRNATGETEPFVKTVKRVSGIVERGIILISSNIEAIEGALKVLDGGRPLIYAATAANVGEVAPLAKQYGASVAASASNLDELAELTTRIAEMGIQDIVLNVPTDNAAAMIQYNTIMRKMAVRSNFAPFGYPIMNIQMGEDVPSLVSDAVSAICKYSSILIVDSMEYQAILPMMMMRQNIYTDPQKPIQVEPKVYQIGEPNENSPVLVTTNFSLTYFIVSGEIENSGVPAHLVIVESEGMSVLTGWAAGKFTGEKIAAFIKSTEIENKVKTRRLIIPGYVAQISGELEESLPGWEVVVGPQEASDLGQFMKMQVSSVA